MSTKRAVAIRHVPFEDLGIWEPMLDSAGYHLTYVDAGIDNISVLNGEEIDLLFVLGAPIGAYQDNDYPFLTNEITLLDKRIRRDLPTVGICLGAQLIARALGSRVYPNGKKEIGWFPLTLTSEGHQSPAQHLVGDKTSMFHWHGDTFDLPKGATLLASTPVCKNQIFTYGKNTLAIQCHPEVKRLRLEQWWIGHAGELESQKISLETLRKDSDTFAPKLEAQSRLFFNEWLNASVAKGTCQHPRT